jgi:hypothetical protein
MGGAMSNQSGEGDSHHAEGGDWSDLAQHVVDTNYLPPSSVADWKTTAGAYRDFIDKLRRTGDANTADIVEEMGRNGAELLADSLRDLAETNSELWRLEEQGRQQEGSKERFKGSLGSWLRGRRR